MPSNNFSVGRDTSLAIVVNNGLMTTVGLTNFEADPVTTKLKSKDLDGTSHSATIHDCWKGTFKFDRKSPSLDNLWAQLEENYHAGVNDTAGTITQIIREADGSTTQWRYEEVVLDLEKAGAWGGDNKVEQTMSFEASRRRKVQ